MRSTHSLSSTKSSTWSCSTPVSRVKFTHSVPGVEVIKDPAADLTSSALDAHGDILGVWLARAGRRMTITMQTRGTALPRTGYHFSLHAGGATPADRLIAQYDWQGTNADGLVLRNGVLRRVDDRVFTVTRHGNTVSLAAPWPITDTTTAFFLARAWTTRGKATLDQTATSNTLIQSVSRR